HTAAGNDRTRLPARLLAWRARRLGHHRRGDPALAGADPVRHRYGTVGATAVPGRHPAWIAAGGGVLRLGAVVRALQELPVRVGDAGRGAAARDLAGAAGDGGAGRGADGDLW